MKIALDATYSLGENPSGVGVYCRELLLGLAAAHPESQFLYCYRPHRYFGSFRVRLPANSRRTLLQEPWLPRSADLFHGLNQRLPRIQAGPRFRRLVSTFHDLFVLTGDYSTPEFRTRFAEQARHAAAGSDAIIAVSEFTADQVHQLLGVERSRLHVVHHGIRALPRRPAAGREKIVLHVGAIQRRKNIVRLVKAFETLPDDWRLVLAGSSGFGGAEILSYIDSSASRERIQVLGYVSSDALAGWYSRALIFAFPSLDEGFGMPVLEAMAAGVPVVTSNRSALPEVAGNAALLIDPESTSELADALGRLVFDQNLRLDLICRGLRRAAEFSWAEAVNRTWALYAALMEE